jgi:hypothetical protein
MVLTTRLKILCGVAAAIGVFIVVTWPSEEQDAAASTSQASVVSAAPRAARGAPQRVDKRESGNLLVRLAHRVTDSKAAGSLFHTQSWYVAPPPPPPAPVVYVPPPPPTAPPVPFTVMGSYAHPGDATVYFLTRGDRVFDVHVGDTIDGIYSVDGAANGQLQLTYKPLNIQQTLPLGDSK